MHEKMQDPLLQKVLAAPRDDDARLAFAAQLRAGGSPQGELIELQVREARGVASKPEVERSLALLAQHREAWLAPLGAGILDATFHRGFPSLVKVTGATLRSRAAELFALAPIEHLDVVEMRGDLDPVLSLPQLAQIRSLGLANNELGDAHAAALTRVRIDGLRWLDLSGNQLTSVGMAALVTSPLRTQLVHCGLARNAVEDPCERPIDSDEYGQIVEVSHPSSGKALEAAHGHVPWLHVHTSDILGFPPDRFA